ncbi:MAG: rhomboid family intramembrane serine protease, partial [Bacteroidota bacterium]
MNDLQLMFQAPVASGILLITIITSLRAFKDGNLMYKFIFSPYRLVHHKEYQMLFSSALIHANYMHLIFNMLVFYFFAFSLEINLGHIQFLILYLGSVMLSHLPRVVLDRDNEFYSALGASGGVSAIVMSMILLYPDMRLSLFGIINDIPGWLFGLLYMAFS